MFVCIVGCTHCICTAYALDTDMRYTQALSDHICDFGVIYKMKCVPNSQTTSQGG